MLETQTNILSDVVVNQADAVCFTSNGIVKRNGEAVMGAGVALAFKQKWATIPILLAKSLRLYGNSCRQVAEVPRGENRIPLQIYAFPTKHHWMDPSDPQLIVQSAAELRFWADLRKLHSVWLTRPGCGNGGLSWSEVKPLLELHFDDRFVICHL